jgi:hypothetical protein
MAATSIGRRTSVYTEQLRQNGLPNRPRALGTFVFQWAVGAIRPRGADAEAVYYALQQHWVEVAPAHDSHSICLTDKGT